MSKFEKEVGIPKVADVRRTPVADDPNRIRKASARHSRRPFVLKVTYPGFWPGQREYTCTHRYDSAKSRAQARAKFTKDPLFSRRGPPKFTEIDE